MLDSALRVVFGGETDGSGAFVLRALPGRKYRVRVRKLGFETSVSEEVSVPPGGVSGLRVAIRVSPVMLDTLEVAATRVCSVAESGKELLLGTWLGARENLGKMAESGSGSTHRFLVEIREQTLDRDLKVREGRVDTVTVDNIPGFAFADAADLLAFGWGWMEGGVITRLYGPSPDVTMSAWFGANHCFRLVKGTVSDSLVGVGFETIDGSLSISMRIVRIDFRFTGPLALERASEQGGDVSFDVDGTGQWYVSEWHIRSPEWQRARSYPGNRLRGYTERSGRVLLVTPKGVRVASRGYWSRLSLFGYSPGNRRVDG